MRVRNVLGAVAGVMLILSGAAHSLLGWPELQQQLATAATPADLVRGLKIGWHFGGVSMVAFGAIATMLFLDRLRGRPRSTSPALVTGVAYVAFGVWAMFAFGFNPFFAVFIVPGLALVLAAGHGAQATP